MIKNVFTVVAVLLLVSSVFAAGDFDWVKDFNVQARADESGFKARLATRFQIGNTQINAVMGNVDSPADAYIVLRLGEMAHQPADYVIRQYKARKGKGWGVIAKDLGIKPGSKEFHALKRGSDLYDERRDGKGKPKGKGKGKHISQETTKNSTCDKRLGCFLNLALRTHAFIDLQQDDI